MRWADLDRDEQKMAKRLFKDRVFPVLTPLAVDPAHPFPYISGLSLNLAVVVRNPKTGTEHFARVKVPADLRALRAARQPAVRAARGRHRRAPQEAVPGHGGARQPHTFRVTRNEDLEVEEDDAENLLKALEKELLRRRFGPPVRLEVEESIEPAGPRPARLRARRQRRGGLPPARAARPHRAARHRRPRPRGPEVPRVRARPPTRSSPRSSRPPRSTCSTSVRRHDVLLHHPYDSFATSVQRFLEQAAADPHVLAIKQTLYRTSGDSPIIDALVDAAEAGKQVLVIVEIKARFDEQANIRWARKLEQAGCHVVYGLVGLKTHCKLAMVVRDEPDGIRRYTHIGTGNYNPKTARLYEDLGLLTADEAIGEDVAHLFNNLSGLSLNTTYDSLLVAPESVRDGLIERIHREIQHHQAGRPAGIRIKANSIVDERVIDALYLASQAGRPRRAAGARHLRLRPGVPGLSETITVRSILGRFLEHSRVFRFANGGEPESWIGSADLMHRNLDRRVEVLVRLPGDGQPARGRPAARPGLRRRDERLGARRATAPGAATAAPSTSTRS